NAGDELTEHGRLTDSLGQLAEEFCGDEDRREHEEEVRCARPALRRSGTEQRQSQERQRQSHRGASAGAGRYHCCCAPSMIRCASCSIAISRPCCSLPVSGRYSPCAVRLLVSHRMRLRFTSMISTATAISTTWTSGRLGSLMGLLCARSSERRIRPRMIASADCSLAGLNPSWRGNVSCRWL